MPQTAAAVDLFRRHFGPGVALTGAQEGDQRYRDPGAFATAWSDPYSLAVAAALRDVRGRW